MGGLKIFPDHEGAIFDAKPIYLNKRGPSGPLFESVFVRLLVLRLDPEWNGTDSVPVETDRREAEEANCLLEGAAYVRCWMLGRK